MADFDLISLIVWVAGVCCVSRLLKDVLTGVYAKFLRPGKDLKRYGKWALVTGATDGIGKAYAFELAKRGMSIVLVSRTESKLSDVKTAILEKYPKVEVTIVAADMGNLTDDVKEKLQKTINSIELGVLVNNVGVSYPYPKFYHELDDANAESLVSLNVTSTNVMTRLALPGMLDRKRGAIVNISSFAGEIVNPLLAGYCGAKGGITLMTASLNAEYAGKGVHFQAQTPLFVTTKLAKIRKSSITTPTPETYARSACNAIGYEAVTSPYWAHALMTYIAQCIPTSIANGQIMKMHLGLRKRGQAKDAKEAGQ
eukprot:TRINITY_DN8584_c1_g2_i1.p1 TRINITY_DN8584_c1_g2~~TRINITY_DN8584_c1_g2_i1.p1  ORF type:complete len:312 (+),score=56.63 TRINITY_DN8584_c1_g2_i1:407-1342(+)